MLTPRLRVAFISLNNNLRSPHRKVLQETVSNSELNKIKIYGHNHLERLLRDAAMTKPAKSHTCEGSVSPRRT